MDDFASRVESVVQQMLASPQGLLGRQFFPFLGPGRNQTGRVPTCRLYNTAVQSIPNGGARTAITFDTELVDTDGMHDSTNPTRITIRTPGVYTFEGCFQWASAPGAASVLTFRLNGGATLLGAKLDLRQIDQLVSAPYALAAGDYVDFTAEQSTAGAINSSFAAHYAPMFGAALVGNL